MARKRDKPEEIMSKLRQVEVLQGEGSPHRYRVVAPAPQRGQAIQRPWLSTPSTGEHHPHGSTPDHAVMFDRGSS